MCERVTLIGLHAAARRGGISLNTKLVFLALAVAGLVAPIAAASVTIYGNSAPANMVAAPFYYYADNYALALQPGDEVSVQLAYASQGGSDLDLLLSSPFYAPVPIPPAECAAANVAGCQAAVQHYVDQRVGRVTCADAVGASENHPDGGVESFTASATESGAHQLTVVTYLAANVFTPYTLTVTVMRGGSDVTASVLTTTPTSTYTINNYVHCAALGLRN